MKIRKPVENECKRDLLCCQTNAGWFAPGEILAAAQFLGLSEKEFCERYIVWHLCEMKEHTLQIPSPAKVTEAGEAVEPCNQVVSSRYYNQKGICIFLKGDTCQIYPHRPLECRYYFCQNDEADNLSKFEIGILWVEDLKKRLSF